MRPGRLCITFSILWILPNLHAEQLISFFFQPYPMGQELERAEKLKQKLGHPSKRARIAFKQMMTDSHIISGIFTTYAGFLTVSDLNGQVQFPRKHPAPTVSLIIAERITPIVRSGNTLSHWELNLDYPAQMYSIIRYENPDIDQVYFITHPQEIPENGVVPIDAIVLFAPPKYVYVPLGLHESYQSPHLLLPDIFVKSGITLQGEALYVLNVMHYFGLLTFLF